jgi:hypothetical protein
VASLTLHWSFGNGKLRRTRTVSFNLPAFRSADGFTVCPGAGKCAAVCYARQARYNFPAVKRTREINLAIVRADLGLFERLAVLDLEQVKQRIVRVHDSGDFFSQEYLAAWFRVMGQFPRKRFYAYSKSLHLDFSAQPSNFQLVQSVGGKFDARIDYEQSHTRIFVSHSERRAAGYCDATHTDHAAVEGRQRIGLVYHGSTKLNPRTILLIQNG